MVICFIFHVENMELGVMLALVYIVSYIVFLYMATIIEFS
jgi:hypothetical protein